MRIAAVACPFDRYSFKVFRADRAVFHFEAGALLHDVGHHPGGAQLGQDQHPGVRTISFNPVDSIRLTSSFVPNVPLPAAHQTLMPCVSRTRIHPSTPAERRAQRIEGELVIGGDEYGRIRSGRSERIQPRLHPVQGTVDTHPRLEGIPAVGSGDLGGGFRESSVFHIKLLVYRPCKRVRHPPMISASFMSQSISQWIPLSFFDPLSGYPEPTARWIVPPNFSSKSMFLVNLGMP